MTVHDEMTGGEFHYTVFVRTARYFSLAVGDHDFRVLDRDQILSPNFHADLIRIQNDDIERVAYFKRK